MSKYGAIRHYMSNSFHFLLLPYGLKLIIFVLICNVIFYTSIILYRWVIHLYHIIMIFVQVNDLVINYFSICMLISWFEVDILLIFFFYNFSKPLMQISLSLLWVQDDHLVVATFRVLMMFFRMKLF